MLLCVACLPSDDSQTFGGGARTVKTEPEGSARSVWQTECQSGRHAGGDHQTVQW